MDKELYIRIKAKDEFTRTIRKLQNQVKQLRRNIEKTLSLRGIKLPEVTKQVSGIGTTIGMQMGREITRGVSYAVSGSTAAFIAEGATIGTMMGRGMREQLKQLPAEFSKIEKELLDLIKTGEVRSIGKGATIQVVKSVKSIWKEARKIAKENIEKSATGISRIISNVKTKFISFKDTLSKVATKSDEFVRRLWRMKGTFLTIIGVIAGATYALKKYLDTVKNAIKSVVTYSDTIERLKIRLEVLTGSTQKAARIFDYFKEVAKKTPFKLEEITEAGVQLRAFGMDVERWLVPALDLAAATGMDLREAIYALGRAYASGAGAARIFRTRGILEMISSFAKLKGITDINKLSIEEWRELLHEFLTEEEGRISGATEKLAGTLTGILSMISDHIARFKEQIGKAGVYEDVKRLFREIKSILDRWEKEGKIKKWSENIATGFRVLIEAIENLLSKEDSFAGFFDKISEKFIKVNAHLVIFCKNFSRFVDMVTYFFRAKFSSPESIIKHTLRLIGEIERETPEWYIPYPHPKAPWTWETGKGGKESEEAANKVRATWRIIREENKRILDELDRYSFGMEMKMFVRLRRRIYEIEEEAKGMVQRAYEHGKKYIEKLYGEITEKLKEKQEKVREQIGSTSEEVKQFFEMYDQIATGIATTLSDLIMGVKKDWGEALYDMLKRFTAWLIEITTRAAILRFIFGVSLSDLGVGGAILGTLMGGGVKGYQEGGYVNKPTLALVGESGGEYIIPEDKLEYITSRNNIEIHVHNATPSTYVEVLTNLPTPHKTKIWRNLKKVDRL